MKQPCRLFMSVSAMFLGHAVMCLPDLLCMCRRRRAPGARVRARMFGTACAYDLGKDSSLENEIEEISMVCSAFD